MRLIYFGVSAGVTGDPVEGDCEENEGFFFGKYRYRSETLQLVILLMVKNSLI